MRQWTFKGVTHLHQARVVESPENLCLLLPASTPVSDTIAVRFVDHFDGNRKWDAIYGQHTPPELALPTSRAQLHKLVAIRVVIRSHTKAGLCGTQARGCRRRAGLACAPRRAHRRG